MFIAIWLVFCVMVGVLASSKNRSFFGYFLWSFLLSPVIGLIMVLIAGDYKPSKISYPSDSNCPKCGEATRESWTHCQQCAMKLGDTV